MTDSADCDRAPLDDGTYDVFVLDLDESTHELSLTIVSGEHRGDVLSLRVGGLSGGFVELVGTPGTLVVRDGKPSVTFED